MSKSPPLRTTNLSLLSDLCFLKKKNKGVEANFQLATNYLNRFCYDICLITDGEFTNPAYLVSLNPVSLSDLSIQHRDQFEIIEMDSLYGIIVDKIYLGQSGECRVPLSCHSILRTIVESILQDHLDSFWESVILQMGCTLYVNYMATKNQFNSESRVTLYSLPAH